MIKKITLEKNEKLHPVFEVGKKYGNQKVESIELVDMISAYIVHLEGGEDVAVAKQQVTMVWN